MQTTDVRTWQQVLAAHLPGVVTIAVMDPSARAAVERWHLDRARVRLLAVLIARVPDAPEPDDSDELADAWIGAKRHRETRCSCGWCWQCRCAALFSEGTAR